MATGDISNNIRKMRSKLKEIKYSGDFDVNAFVDGLPTAYLAIYHYAFTGYTPTIAKLLLDTGIELFGKPDARFIKSMYKILRDVFAYKPPVTKEQFFAKGFAERKVIMCTEIIQLIKIKNRQLNPVAPKTLMKTSVRPNSTTETKHLPLAVPKTRPESAKISPRTPAKVAPEIPPHIVNELTYVPASHPVRHVSSSSRHIQPIRCMAGLGQLDDDYQDTSIVEIRASTCDNVLQTPVPTPHSDMANLYRAVETLTGQVMQLAQVQEKADNAIKYQQGAENVRCHHRADNCNNIRYEQGAGNAGYQQGAGNVGTDKILETVMLTLENTTSRMLLLENRMSIIEAKIGDIQPTTTTSTCVASNLITPTQPNMSENPVIPVMHYPALPEDSLGLFTGPGNSFANELEALSSSQKAYSVVRENSNLSLVFSPIRKVANGAAGTMMSANEDTFAMETEDNARRSSTPTMGRAFAGDCKVNCDISHLQTKDVVSSIQNMIEETTRMMKETTTQDTLEKTTVDITS